MTDHPTLCILASGSSGNCSLVAFGPPGARRVLLIDAGIGARRLFRHLHALGVRPHQVAGIVLTHLDTDHWRPGFLSAAAKIFGKLAVERWRPHDPQRPNQRSRLTRLQ